jgi:hypothetical protein
MRGAPLARQRDHALFHCQLRVRGEPYATVPLIDAAPIGWPQAGRHLGGLGRVQAGHRLELLGQHPVRDLF